MAVEDRLDPDGRLRQISSIKTSAYLTPNAQKGEGILGQPRPHFYFHRSLQDLLGPAFAAGFVLDGLEEPALPSEHEYAEKLNWRNFPEFPPILVGRLRLASERG